MARVNRRWTLEEDAMILAAKPIEPSDRRHQEGQSGFVKLARALGRTVYAVQARHSRLRRATARTED